MSGGQAAAAVRARDRKVQKENFNGAGEGSGRVGKERKSESWKRMTKARKGADSLWLAPNLSKRWGEFFFLTYSPFWIALCLGIVVPFQLYEDSDEFTGVREILTENAMRYVFLSTPVQKYQELEYLMLGLVCAVPTFTLPIFLVGKDDAKKPWSSRYWVKANLWIFIFGYVGNYFWTHYFYTVLGATYSFPSYKLNNVPVTTFLLTHAYFLFYHMVSNLTIRRLRNATQDIPSTTAKFIIEVLWIFVLSYLTAFMEAITIANFPYYEMVDRGAMYKFGSFFYAIYFFVSFPMFFRLDENPHRPWSLTQTAIDSLAAAMLVTILLDLWRITIGPIVEIPWGASLQQCASFGLPWLQDTSKVVRTARVHSETVTTRVH